jgi:hypothetical protein
MRYTVGMSAPIFIRLTPEEDARLRNWRTIRSSTPRFGSGPLKSGYPPGAAEFLGRGYSTVLLDLRRWVERGFEGLAEGGWGGTQGNG